MSDLDSDVPDVKCEVCGEWFWAVEIDRDGLCEECAKLTQRKTERKGYKNEVETAIYKPVRKD